MVQAVLTDLGGVLIDYSFDRAASEWARFAGVDANALRENLVVDEAWKQFEVGRLTEGRFCDHLRRRCGLDLTDEQVIQGWNSIFIGVNTEVEQAYREVMARGTRVVAVTNTNTTHQRVWRKLFSSSLGNLTAVYSSCEVGARKPDATFFEHVLSAERLEPSEVMFIDDLDINVQAGRALGMDAMTFTDAASLRKELERRGLLGRRHRP